MEDFQAAFNERHRDVIALHEKKRLIASMHMGGIAVECLLKAKLYEELHPNTKGYKEWYDKEKKIPVGHTICNPGHSLVSALRSNNRLYQRVSPNHLYVLLWLHKIENPECHFIDMRYIGKEPDESKYTSWYDAYRKLVGWLLTQRF